jgi:hypothetical protein
MAAIITCSFPLVEVSFKKTAVGNVKRSKELSYLTTCKEAARYASTIPTSDVLLIYEQRGVHLHYVRRRFDEYFSVGSISNVTS